MSAAPLLSEVIVRREDSPQGDLPLASDGVLRFVWEGRFGTMLIEAKNGKTYVNGQVVEQAQKRVTEWPPASAEDRIEANAHEATPLVAVEQLPLRTRAESCPVDDRT